MKHEILKLNEERAYVRIGETWYDTNKHLDPIVGQPFLGDSIEEILTYEEYRAQFPDSTHELFEEVNNKTGHKGSLRISRQHYNEAGVLVKSVQYAVNPLQIHPKEVAEDLEDIGA
jgi:hypothetical protein